MAEYGTTLEEKLKDFEDSVLFKHPEKRQATVVGIVGLGGVGKTTLTNEFFKRRRSDYAGSSFLSDVRESSARGNLTSLQNKLLSDLQGNRDIKIGSLEEGIAILVKNLESCHALIVLDDVDLVDQLDAFLPISHVLDPKSLILFTTRNRDVLPRWGILETSIYILYPISFEDSLEIFCSYAFSQSCPPQGFESVVDQFVELCHGFPLLLKAFGGLLCGENDQFTWQGVLDRLRNIIPSDILSQLRICYDSLVEEEQEIFLDIACFSIGKDKDTWIGIWDESGWKGLVGFQNLMNRQLVEVDTENKIVMHDHLRNLGRDMVKDKVPRRFWRPTIEDLREQLSSGITQVRGISMYPGDTIRGYVSRRYYTIGSSLEPFGMISNLHFLEAEGSVVESILTKVRSPKLMWLHWINCPHSSLPPWLPMHDLRVLEVAGKELNILWKCESQAPMHLRELIVDAPLSKFPKSLEQLKHLKMIEAKEAYLATLPEEFCWLPFLKYIKLKDYQILPDSDGNFSNIQLTDGRNQESISDSMDNLKNLNLTDLERCTSLEMLLTAIVWRHFQSP